RRGPSQRKATRARQAEPNGRAPVSMIANGREVVRHDTGGSPDADYRRPEALRGVKLEKGGNRTSLPDRGKRPLILDNLVLQPVRSFAEFRLPGKEKVIFLRDLEKERNLLTGR